MDQIKKNLDEVLHNITQASKKTNRTLADITLIGVTKTIDIPRIAHLVSCCVTHLGENRVQELLTKIPAFDPSMVQWHLIGHLQRNKVKYIIDKVSLIHSVDNLSLAEEIDRQAKKHNKIMDILVEVNIGEEDSKHGLPFSDITGFIDELGTLSNICIKGLMCVAPFVDNPEENRPLFKKMYQLFVDIRSKSNNNNLDMTYLSMGMTNDYAVAIEEGSNMVRIGTGLFGQR